MTTTNGFSSSIRDYPTFVIFVESLAMEGKNARRVVYQMEAKEKLPINMGRGLEANQASKSLTTLTTMVTTTLTTLVVHRSSSKITGCSKGRNTRTWKIGLVNRVVGETIRPDVTVTHPGTLTEQNDSGLAERLALSSEPDPTDGYVTCTKLKEDNVKSEDPLSSDLGKISDLVEEEVHRLMEISEKMKEIEASDINMPQKALETKKVNTPPGTTMMGPQP